MPEEQLVVEPEEVSTEEVVVEDSPMESQARGQGWVTSDEWVEQGKEADEWVDAKTFNMRGEFFDKIHSQKREIQDLKVVVDDLKQLNSKVAEKERDKVIKELKEAKVRALEEEDHAAVVDIDEELADMRTESAKPAEAPVIDQAQFQNDFNNWRSGNEWYDSDTDLQVYADAIGNRLAQQSNGSMSYQEIFVEVGKKVRESFPHKFQNSNRQKQTVSSTTRTSKSSVKGSNKTFDDLNEDQQRIAKRFDRLGVKSVADYIIDLEELGEL